MPEIEKTTKNNKKKRNNILRLLALFFILAGVGYGAYYYLYAQFYESTDNAYVKQNIIYVTPQISGIVDTVYINETQYVKNGDLLVKLDDRDLKLSFEQAKENLANTVRNIQKLYKQREVATSSLELAKITLKKATVDLKREDFLLKHHVLADEIYLNFKYTYNKANKNVEIAKQKIAELNSILKNKNISKNPEILKAAIEVKQNYLNLKRCDILAPVSGVIAKKMVNKGQHVGVTSTILAIVPMSGFWVDANFKETQLHYMRIGQNVEMYSDLYGKDVKYRGVVEGINPGTGSVFSLLPAQNATGNWIKIVQRIPVRIKLNQDELTKHPLHVGNSMQVRVDVRKYGGDIYSKISAKKENSPQLLYQDAIKESEIIVRNIIKKNM